MNEPLLLDATQRRERERMRTAALDLLVDRGLGRPTDLTDRSGYHAQFARAGLPLSSPWSVFVQDVMKPQTILGKLSRYTSVAVPGVQVVDLGPIPVGDFIAEGAPMPVVTLPIATAFAEVSKIGWLVAFDGRVFESARPAVEQALAAGIAAAEDYRLLDDEPAVIGARPAGLRNGAPVFVAAGTSAPELFAALSAASAAVRGGHKVAIATEATVGALPPDIFPAARTDGTGYLGTLPLIVAAAGPVGLVVVVAATALAVVDGGVEIAAGAEASIDFATPPGVPPQALVSMWQTNSVAVRTRRVIWWYRPADATAVVDFGLTGS